jgi:FkbM family methyltransferase
MRRANKTSSYGKPDVALPLFLHVHDAQGISAEDIRQAHLRDIALGRQHQVDYRRYWVDIEAGKFFCLVEAPTASTAEAVHVDGHGMLPSEVYRVREGLRDRQDFEAMRILFTAGLATDSNCVDVGASRGTILREMLRRAPEGRHIAYEPIPDVCTGLAARYPQVDVRQAALSSRPGERTFVHLPQREGYSHLLRDTDEQPEPSAELISVRVDTLDGELPDDYAPTLIKIDVEGEELEVLRGAREALATFRPIVIFEHGAGRPDDSKELFDLLSQRTGLRLYDIDGNGPLGRREFLEVIAGLRVWNYVARP